MRGLLTGPTFSRQCSAVNGGCGGGGRAGEAVDEFVISLVLAEQRARAASATVEEAETWPNAPEPADVEADIAALTKAAKAEEITVSTLLQLLSDLERRRDELKAVSLMRRPSTAPMMIWLLSEYSGCGGKWKGPGAVTAPGPFRGTKREAAA